MQVGCTGTVEEMFAPKPETYLLRIAVVSGFAGWRARGQGSPQGAGHGTPAAWRQRWGLVWLAPVGSRAELCPRVPSARSLHISEQIQENQRLFMDNLPTEKRGKINKINHLLRLARPAPRSAFQ